jgi:hypothetical protein
VYRGRPGRGAGPDFRDAIIATPDGLLLHGDVELHLQANDFYAHGHHKDHAYDNLALHVVFWADDTNETILSSGRGVPIVALGAWVQQRAAQLEGILTSPPLWREPCQEAMARLGKAEVIATLERLGDRRFLQKAAFYGRTLANTDGETLLYGGLFEAMGYGNDRRVFIDLSVALPLPVLQEAARFLPEQEQTLTIEALLFGAAGFLARSGSGSYPQALQERWQILGQPVTPLLKGWPQPSGRPINQPQRRLAGLARLLDRYLERGLLAGLRENVDNGSSAASLVNNLSVPAEGNWADHLDLAGKPWRNAPALIGKARAIEIATNVVLPLLYAWGEANGDAGLANVAMKLYRELPLPSSYGQVEFLRRYLGDDKLIKIARHQQALLYLLQNYCSRGGCGRCPLS